MRQALLRKIKVGPEASIREAAQIIQDSQVKIVLVCDADSLLLGTVTDGDIRRAVLQSVDLDGSVAQIMNRHPKVVTHEEPDWLLREQMRTSVIRHLPRVDEAGHVVDLALLDEIEDVRHQEAAVLLMAGGRGERLMPMTSDVPKPLLLVGNKPVLQRQIEQLVSHGFHRFYISVNYLAHKIEEFFGDGSKFGVEISYVRENKPLGTAGALSVLEAQSAPLVVMNSDIICKTDFARMVLYFEEEGVDATMGVREYFYSVPYGCISLNGTRIATIEEKPTFRHLISAGIYVVSPDALSFVPRDEFYNMPDLFEALIAAGRLTNTFQITEEWIDIGQKEDLYWAQKLFAGEDGDD